MTFNQGLSIAVLVSIGMLNPSAFGNIINPHDSNTDQTHHIKWGTVVPDGSTVTTATYYLHDHGGAEAMTSEMKDRFRDAYDLWEGFSLLDYVEVFSDTGENIHTHVTNLTGANGVFKFAFASLHHYTGTDTHVVHDFHDGTTLVSPLQGWTEVALDVRSDWYTGSGTPGAAEFDFLSIAIHEVGHSTGLAHSNDPISPMFNSSDGVLDDSDDTSSIVDLFSHLGLGETLRVPTPHDVSHQVELYGVPEPSSIILAVMALGGLIACGFRKRCAR